MSSINNSSNNSATGSVDGSPVMQSPAVADRDYKKRNLLAFYGLAPQSPANPEPTPVPVAPPNPADLVSLDSTHFSLPHYLNDLYAKTTLPNLLTTSTGLSSEIAGLDSHLQTLIYSNYSSFLHATDTVRTMQSSLSLISDNISHLNEKIQEMSNLNDTIYTNLQKNKNEIVNKSEVVERMKKRLWLWDLPGRMKKCVDSEYYGECMRLWNKGRKVLKRYESVKSVQKILEECQKIVSELETLLWNKVVNQKEEDKTSVEEMNKNTEWFSIIAKLKQGDEEAEATLKKQFERIFGKRSLENWGDFCVRYERIFGENNREKTSIELKKHQDEVLTEYYNRIRDNLKSFIMSENELLSGVDAQEAQEGEDTSKTKIREMFKKLEEGYVEDKTLAAKLSRVYEDLDRVNKTTEVARVKISATEFMSRIVYDLIDELFRELVSYWKKSIEDIFWTPADSNSSTSEVEPLRRSRMDEISKKNVYAVVNKVGNSFEKTLQQAFGYFFHALDDTPLGEDENPYTSPSLSSRGDKAASNSKAQSNIRELSFLNYNLVFNKIVVCTQASVLELNEHICNFKDVINWDCNEMKINDLMLLSKFLIIFGSEKMSVIAGIVVKTKDESEIRHGIELNVPELNDRIKKTVFAVMEAYTKAQGVIMGRIIEKRVEARQWSKLKKEPRKVGKSIVSFVEDFKEVSAVVSYMFLGIPKEFMFLDEARKDSAGSDIGTGSELSSGRGNKGPTGGLSSRATPKKSSSKFGASSGLDDFFNEKLVIFGRLSQLDPKTIMTNIWKIVVKNFYELIRMQTMNKYGLQQLQVESQYIMQTLRDKVVNESVFEKLLVELRSSAEGRCNEPESGLEMNVIQNIVDAEIQKSKKVEK